MARPRPLPSNVISARISGLPRPRPPTGGGPLLSTIGSVFAGACFADAARGVLPLPRAESFFPATSPSASLLRAGPARLMRHQQAISAELLGTRVGKTVEVMVDEVDAGGAIARSHWDAPEIDGNVYLRGATGLKPGDRVNVMVEAADDYDLFARRTDAEARPAAPRRTGAIRYPGEALWLSARPPSETFSSPAFAGMTRRLVDEDLDVVTCGRR